CNVERHAKAPGPPSDGRTGAYRRLLHDGEPFPRELRSRHRAMTDSRALPLKGIRVIEIAQNLAGPYCAEILAHLGADVIKVERREGGDDTRGWGPPFLEGAGTSFHAVNLGKRSVAVDLKKAAEVARLLPLIDQADVLVQNLRPGSMDALGLDAATLTGRNPKLIYCSLGALGSVGPLKDRPGFDPMEE